MDISNLNKLFCTVLILICSCQSKQDKKKEIDRVKKECEGKTSIDGIGLSFIGYPYDEINSLDVKIYGTQEKAFKQIVPEKIIDTLRLKRFVFIDYIINLRDSILLIFPNKEQFLLTDFEYNIQPNFRMMSEKWHCGFNDMKINDIPQGYGSAVFLKKDFNLKSKNKNGIKI